jgi:predicted nucleic acid-binding protein
VARYLLDTDAVIDLLNAVSSTVEIVEDVHSRGDTMCTCAVVVAEIHAGLHAPDRVRGACLLTSMWFLATTADAAEQAGSWRYGFARRGRQLSTTDCLIAATALEHGATLITGNDADYPMAEVRRLPLPRSGPRLR